VAPRTVRFRFERSPRHARIVEGDLEVGDELEVTADGSAHRFVVTAPGFVAREISAVADQDRVLRATLRRRGRRGDEPQSSEELLTF
jgi:hypothetical protein